MVYGLPTYQLPILATHQPLIWYYYVFKYQSAADQLQTDLSSTTRRVAGLPLPCNSDYRIRRTQHATPWDTRDGAGTGRFVCLGQVRP